MQKSRSVQLQITVEAHDVALRDLRRVTFLEFCVPRSRRAVGQMRPTGAMGMPRYPDRGEIVRVSLPKLVTSFSPGNAHFIAMLDVELDTTLPASSLSDLRCLQIATGRPQMLGSMWRECFRRELGPVCVGTIKKVLAK